MFVYPTSVVFHSAIPLWPMTTSWEPVCKENHETIWLCIPVPSVLPSRFPRAWWCIRRVCSSKVRSEHGLLLSCPSLNIWRELSLWCHQVASSLPALPNTAGWAGWLSSEFQSASWIHLNFPLTLILTVKLSPPTGALDLDNTYQLGNWRKV